MTTKWQRLRLSTQGAVPPLLFKYSPTASGYSLYLTDLNYIWSECLDRKAILKRADEEDTTIDPSEDSEQFNVLLQKIGEGLQGNSSSLTPQYGTTTLELRVTSKLPAPLRPLEWRIQLSKDSQSSTTGHLLIPLIRAEGDSAARQQSLIEELGKKDWVLAKLFDKIEAMGIDISTVFPGTTGLRSSGRKGPTLAQAAKYIKGLAPFNEQAWQQEATQSSSKSGLAADIIKAISGDQVPKKLDSLQPPPDDWWIALTSTTKKGNSKSQEPKSLVEAIETDTGSGSETGDEEFERQETPPRLKKPAETTTEATPNDMDEVTQSEDEDIHIPQREKVNQTTLEHRTSPTKAAPAGKPKGLGTIGGKKQAQNKVPTSPKQQPLKPPVSDDENESTDDEQQASPKRPPAKISRTNEISKAGPKVSRGLGVIGGKKKEPNTAPEPPKSQAKPAEESQYPEPGTQTQSEPKKKKPLGKLGVIGGSKAKSKPKPKPSAEPRESISPAPSSKVEEEDKATKEELQESPHARETKRTPADRKVKKETLTLAEPERRETEQERADRKREELKRQLEAKSKAPAKKKRRF